jgi:hypothetical protein
VKFPASSMNAVTCPDTSPLTAMGKAHRSSITKIDREAKGDVLDPWRLCLDPRRQANHRKDAEQGDQWKKPSEPSWRPHRPPLPGGRQHGSDVKRLILDRLRTFKNYNAVPAAGGGRPGHPSPGRGDLVTRVRAGSARHREPLVLGGHQRSRPASENRRSLGIHRYDLSL